MIENIPLISVIMSVYNTEIVFLKEAIDSILNQTFSNFRSEEHTSELQSQR